MSRSLRARLARLEQGPPAAQELGREVLALVDQYIADGGDVADLMPLFGLGDTIGEKDVT